MSNFSTEPKDKKRVEGSKKEDHAEDKSSPFPAPVMHRLRQNSSWRPVNCVMSPAGYFEQNGKSGKNYCISNQQLSFIAQALVLIPHPAALREQKF